MRKLIVPAVGLAWLVLGLPIATNLLELAGVDFTPGKDGVLWALLTWLIGGAIVVAAVAIKVAKLDDNSNGP